MPTLALHAIPNGAGKTTFINGFLRQRAEAFVKPAAGLLIKRSHPYDRS